MEEFTLETIRDYFLMRGGQVTNKELVGHFKSFLTHPDTKVASRARFKEYVDILATVYQNDGKKYLVLKPKHSNTLMSIASNMQTAQQPARSSRPKLPPYIPPPLPVVSASTHIPRISSTVDQHSALQSASMVQTSSISDVTETFQSSYTHSRNVIPATLTTATQPMADVCDSGSNTAGITAHHINNSHIELFDDKRHSEVWALGQSRVRSEELIAQETIPPSNPLSNESCTDRIVTSLHSEIGYSKRPIPISCSNSDDILYSTTLESVASVLSTSTNTNATIKHKSPATNTNVNHKSPATNTSVNQQSPATNTNVNHHSSVTNTSVNHKSPATNTNVNHKSPATNTSVNQQSPATNTNVNHQTSTANTSVKHSKPLTTGVGTNSTSTISACDTRKRSVDEEASEATAVFRAWSVASACCDYMSMVRLLKDQPSLAHRRDPLVGYTALHWASKHGSCDVIKLLAGTHGVSVMSQTRSAGYTPLHLAVMHGHREAVHLLMRVYGADMSTRDYSGKKAQHYHRSKTSIVGLADTRPNSTATGSKAHDYLFNIPVSRPAPCSAGSRRNSRASNLLRIGSLNVRVKKTTEAFNQLLVSNQNKHERHKPLSMHAPNSLNVMKRRRNKLKSESVFLSEAPFNSSNISAPILHGRKISKPSSASSFYVPSCSSESSKMAGSWSDLRRHSYSPQCQTPLEGDLIISETSSVNAAISHCESDSEYACMQWHEV